MRLRLRLIKPCSGRKLTVWGWVLIFLTVAAGITWWATSVQHFLSPVSPLPQARVLMVEGFLPDYALKQASIEFGTNSYDVLITTGQQITQGAFLSEYHSLADVAYETLKLMGVDTARMYSAPAKPVWRDRSVANAEAGFEKLKLMGIKPCGVNVMSLGPHSRRSWIIYRNVGEKMGFQTGIIAVVDSTYDERAWWRSSRGLRAVFSESLGYYYVALFGLSD